MTTSRNTRASEPGFTLLELMVVISLLGLVAGVAAVRWGGTYRQARLSAVAEELVHFERLVRDYCLRTGKEAVLVFNTRQNTVEVCESGARHRQSQWRKLTIPSVVALDRAVVCGRKPLPGQAVEVAVDTVGQTEAYAVCLAAAKQQRWLLFAGLSGQVIELEDARDVERTLQALASPGTHAD